MYWSREATLMTLGEETTVTNLVKCLKKSKATDLLLILLSKNSASILDNKMVEAYIP